MALARFSLALRLGLRAALNLALALWLVSPHIAHAQDEPLDKQIRSISAQLKSQENRLVEQERLLKAQQEALALRDAAGDGSLVVKNGQGVRGLPIVTLVISGAAIGHVTGDGQIVVDDLTPSGKGSVEVTGAGTKRTDLPDSRTKWGGADFRFRAVGSVYRITIYGGYVDLVASGWGNVVLAGVPDTPKGDGVYSLNGLDWHSLPGTPTKQLAIGTPPASTG